MSNIKLPPLPDPDINTASHIHQRIVGYTAETVDRLRREAVEAALAVRGEPVEGGVLVSVDELNNWKALANETAARSVKAERYSVGSELKQRIAEVLRAAKPAQPLDAKGEE